MRKSEKTEKASACTFALTGEVTDIYEGKNADYVTVKVTRGEYYDLLRVSVNDRTNINGSYKAGNTCAFTGTVSTFWNKEKKVTIYNFNADSVKEL